MFFFSDKTRSVHHYSHRRTSVMHDFIKENGKVLITSQWQVLYFFDIIFFVVVIVVVVMTV